MDTTGRGYLDKAQFRALAQKHLFRDQTMPEEEMNEAVEELFSTIDSDQNGMITLEELHQTVQESFNDDVSVPPSAAAAHTSVAPVSPTANGARTNATGVHSSPAFGATTPKQFSSPAPASAFSFDNLDKPAPASQASTASSSSSSSSSAAGGDESTLKLQNDLLQMKQLHEREMLHSQVLFALSRARCYVCAAPNLICCLIAFGR
jgi:hypothetical protein